MVMVDDMAPCLPNRRWRWRESCHLFCDGNLDELHKMAIKIGLKRQWFQDTNALPHYDLTGSKREGAVTCGAVEVDRQTFAKWIIWWRRKQKESIPSATDKRHEARVDLPAEDSERTAR